MLHTLILKRNYSKANEESVNAAVFTDWNFANCIGVSYESGATLILGILLTAGCMGDIALYQKVSKFPDDALVKDHPSKPQFTVYEL